MAEQSENISLPTVKPEAFDIEKDATIVPEQQTKLTRFTNLSSIIGGVSICVLLGVALITSQHHESQSSASKPFSALSGNLLESNQPKKSSSKILKKSSLKISNYFIDYKIITKSLHPTRHDTLFQI
jgi:hypothetical protein